MEKFNYEIKMSGSLIVVFLNGYIDTTTIYKFREIFEEIEKFNAKEIYFDFSKIDYVSSSGWGTLVSNGVKLKQKGIKFSVGKMTPNVKRIYDLMELKRFIIYEDREFKEIGEVEKKVEEIEINIKPLIKNLVVENPFLEEEEMRNICEKNFKRKIEPSFFKKNLIEMGLETREKRLAFAYKTLKKIIEGKR